MKNSLLIVILASVVTSCVAMDDELPVTPWHVDSVAIGGGGEVALTQCYYKYRAVGAQMFLDKSKISFAALLYCGFIPNEEFIARGARATRALTEEECVCLQKGLELALLVCDRAGKRRPAKAEEELARVTARGNDPLMSISASVNGVVIEVISHCAPIVNSPEFRELFPVEIPLPPYMHIDWLINNEACVREFVVPAGV